MKKGFKFLFSLASVLFLAGTVTSCKQETKLTPEEKVQEAYDTIIYEGLTAGIQDNIELIYKLLI